MKNGLTVSSGLILCLSTISRTPVPSNSHNLHRIQSKECTHSFPVDAEAYPGIPEAKKYIEISGQDVGKRSSIFTVSLHPVISSSVTLYALSKIV